MGVLKNLKNIRSIYCNRKEIKMVQINNKIVYQSDEIDSTYNYFVFRIFPWGGDSATITLSKHRAGDETEWDGLTDWGDGTIDSESSHTYTDLEYTTTHTFNIKTKWMINKGFSGDYATKNQLIACNNVNKNIADATYLFYGCSRLKSVDLTRFKAKNVTDMSYMFSGCTSLETVNMRGCNTSNVTNMKRMFYNCRKLVTEVSHLNVSKVTDMGSMFYGCENIDGSQFKNWDVSNVTNMASMFYYSHTTNCLDLSGWDVSDVNSFSYMFYYCSANDGFDISGWNINNSAYVTSMFTHTSCSTCNNIEHHVKHTGVPTVDWNKMTGK